MFENETDEDNWIRKNCGENPDNKFGYGHTEFYKAVNNNLRSETKPLVDGIEGRKSLELVNALYESVETGKIVNLGSYSSKNKLGLI